MRLPVHYMMQESYQSPLWYQHENFFCEFSLFWKPPVCLPYTKPKRSKVMLSVMLRGRWLWLSYNISSQVKNEIYLVKASQANCVQQFPACSEACSMKHRKPVSEFCLALNYQRTSFVEIADLSNRQCALRHISPSLHRSLSALAYRPLYMYILLVI